MTLFGEAIRSAFLPCSFALLIPALVITTLTKTSSRAPTLGAYLLGASLFAWLPFIRVATPLDHNIGGATALGLGLWLLARHTRTEFTLGAGAVIGAFAGATWIPCVGSEFGGILNTGLERPLSAALPMMVYVLGVLMPIVLIVTLIEYVPAFQRGVELRGTRWAAIGLGAALGLVVLVGQYPTLLSELARRSTL